ncbi:MAG: hypothetical protein ACPG1C_07875 [Alphaproteobacteria bacterium]
MPKNSRRTGHSPRLFKITPRFSSYSPGADIVEQMARNMMAFDPFTAIQYGAQLAQEEEPNAPIHDTVIWTPADGFSFDTDDAEPPEVVPDPVEMEGEPIRPDPLQVEAEPEVSHARQRFSVPPTDRHDNEMDVIAPPQMDDSAIKLATTIKIERNEVAYTVYSDGSVTAREGTPSSSPCLPASGGYCLHTHPAEPGQRSQKHRLGFGEYDWRPVQVGMPSYILNLNREVFVMEYRVGQGYVSRFVDKAPYEGD